MFSRLIADVEAFITRREVSKSDLVWCKQNEEHFFFSPNLNLFGLSSLHLNSSGFRFIRGVEKWCFIGFASSFNLQRDALGTFKTSSLFKCACHTFVFLVTRKLSFPSTFPILLHHIVFSGFFRGTLKNETCLACRQHNNN